MDIEKLDSLIGNLITNNPKKEILSKIKELLENPPLKINDLVNNNLPKKSGVYLIYKKEFKKEEFIYAGETDDLRRRLKGDISRGKKKYHTFLNKIGKNKSKEEIKEILNKDYLFSYIETDSKEIAFIIEGILIRIYHPQYNKLKKYQRVNGRLDKR